MYPALKPNMERIAVVMRGHLRTWKYTKDIIQKFYSNISKEVDYYFILWDYEQTRNYDVRVDFPNGNLVKYMVVPIPGMNPAPSLPYEDTLYNGWRGPAHLAKFALPEIQQRKYDMIIETRPDIIPVRDHRYEVVIPGPNDYYTTEFSIVSFNRETRPGRDNVCLDDWMLIMHPDRYEEIANRATVIPNAGIHGHQRELATYIQSRGMKIWKTKWVRTFFTRPNSVEHLPNINFDEGWWVHYKGGNPPDCVKLIHLANDWSVLPIGTKLRLLKKYNFSEEDWKNEFHWRRVKAPSPISQ
jgi:hypothetical protein